MSLWDQLTHGRRHAHARDAWPAICTTMDQATGLLRLAGDVGRCMMSGNWDVQFYPFCLLPLSVFVTLSRVVICAAFNDLPEGQRLMEQAMQRMDQLPDEWHREGQAP